MFKRWFNLKSLGPAGCYLYCSADSAADHTKVLHLHPCGDLCYRFSGHEPQHGRRPRRAISVSSWGFLRCWGLYPCPDADQDFLAHMGGLCGRSHHGSIGRAAYRRFLCQADQAVLRNAPDLIRIFDLGNCFPLVQLLRAAMTASMGFPCLHSLLLQRAPITLVLDRPRNLSDGHLRDFQISFRCYPSGHPRQSGSM